VEEFAVTSPLNLQPLIFVAALIEIVKQPQNHDLFSFLRKLRPLLRTMVVGWLVGFGCWFWLGNNRSSYAAS
jgi:hypothetical protein